MGTWQWGRRVRTILYIQVSRHGKAGERLQYAQPHCEYSWQCDKGYGGLVNVVTKPEWVQMHQGREHSFLLELCMRFERIARVLTVVGIALRCGTCPECPRIIIMDTDWLTTAQQFCAQSSWVRHRADAVMNQSIQWDMEVSETLRDERCLPEAYWSDDGMTTTTSWQETTGRIRSRTWS